jgi:acetolactate synthase-1/2/3 large subunit
MGFGGNMGEKMTAADALVRVLEGEGVELVFGVPGGHVLPFYDALTRSKKIKAVLTRHEEGAAFMARMYTRACGKPAVCVATAGPGATNLVTGVCDAFAENVPLIVITGQVAGALFGMNAAQEATGEEGTPNQVALFAAVTKGSWAVNRPDKVVPKIREAFRLAWGEPYGPVHICIPSDVQAGEVEYQPLAPEQYRVTARNAVDDGALEQAARMLAAASRPAIIAGRRAAFPSAARELKTLVEEFRIPLAATVVAKGLLDEAHPLNLGTLHMFGHRAPDRYLKESDCVLAVGESFEEYSCNYYDSELFPPGRLVHLDCAPGQIGRFYPVALGIEGSIRASLARLAEKLRHLDRQGQVTDQMILDLKGSTRHFGEAEMSSDAEPIKPQRLMAELREHLPPEALVQTDMGQNFFWTLRYFAAPEGRYFGSWGFMPMGSGVAGCIGLALGRPGKRVVCVCGDGAMQMNGMDVATAVEWELPVTWVVLEDGRLGMVHMAQGLSFGERYIATRMHNPNFQAWAEALGARGYRVEKPSETGAVLDAAFAGQGPAVVSVRVDADELLPIKPRVLLLAKKMGLNVEDSRTASRAFRKVLDER